jgi:hypothetical protein
VRPDWRPSRGPALLAPTKHIVLRQLLEAWQLDVCYRPYPCVRAAAAAGGSGPAVRKDRLWVDVLAEVELDEAGQPVYEPDPHTDGPHGPHRYVSGICLGPVTDL